ncbi:peptide chain release factor 2 [Spirochaeta cellobiosiphila]|uniref:peptide chain release factor 2 n=1 Tax=Spirochaeta cellobiosiphila TaxID=504483 RepID=UPI001FE21294|nr:peptide chain release factor 2 [Spirochaeta cellobiosiphila]
MDLQEIQKSINELTVEIEDTWGIFDPDAIYHDIAQKEDESGAPDFWDNRERAEKVLQDIRKLKNRIEPWQDIKDNLSNLTDIIEMLKEESDSEIQAEVEKDFEHLLTSYNKQKKLELLSEPNDDGDAFLTIHSGAGGTEACDWVSMLFRMYSRWCENQNFKFDILDLLEAEGGIKSVTIQVKGDYAFGNLKCESGIHRLVRISPFDSSARRHTSFASVHISPVVDDDIEIDINPDDLRVDTYRAQGAGGQHVNKTESAVRITHLPTNIVVQCQNERSQHKNRDTAMKVLKSRLYEHYKAIQEAEQEKQAAEKKDISWGNQIRSYVFHPYNMVKDHRTKAETGNVQAVMDGAIDQFIEEYLRFTWAQAN